jgi:TonB family protein
MIRKFRNSIFIFIALSMFIHMSFVVTMNWKRSPPPIIQKETVEVTFPEPEEMKPTDARKMKAQEPKPKMEDEIVEQVKQLNDELDPKAHRLSAFNQRVQQETRAKESGKFNNTAKGGNPDAGSKEGDKKQKKIAKKARPKGELPDIDDLIPKYSENAQQAQPDSTTPGEASQTDDYLKDVQTGMQTLLSTREFVYFSYYQRIKDQIRQYWEPGVREKVKIIYRQGRSIASSKDRMTQVLVTLDSSGALIKVEILNSSGVQQLDDAAAEAFKAAAPFPNPPAGMVESDGTIKIRWDFILES